MIKATSDFEAWLEKRVGFEGLDRPAKLSDFQADKGLGEGAYAKVIKVQSRLSGKFYAMKVIAKKKIENYNMKDQLKNEVKIMSQLSHPNIIKLYTIFEDKKNIYFVIELAQELHMYARLSQAGKFPEPVAAKFAYDVFKAVDFLHKQTPSIIHRDLKLENILFTDEGLKITDFGWSNLKDRVSHSMPIN